MQKIKKLLSGSFRYVFLMAFLIVVNVVLDVMLTVWSSDAMKDLIASRMLDITNTAADMIDGDELRDLTPDDKDSPAYNSVMNVLTHFRDNIELKYIYCIRDKGNKEFVFGLDPTVEDPAEFGSPVVYTDALYNASLGIPSVDSDSYQDAWGTFYSAYSPVFASDGSVAGIIAVDFSKDWYDNQMSAQTHTILFVNILSLIISGSMILFMARNDKKRRKAADLLGATADIYLLMYEANLLNDTFTEVYNNKQAAKNLIHKATTSARQVARDITERYTDTTTRQGMLEFVDLDTLSERMKDATTITHEFLSSENRWLRGRFIVCDRAPSGTVTRVLYLVENINAEKRERDMNLEAAKLMNNQLSSVASIYFSMHDIDVVNNTLSEIKTNVTDIANLFAVPTENAQQVMQNKITRSVHKISRKVMLDFVDLSNIEDKFRDSTSITEEFLSYRNVWCRARFIISKQSDEGKIEHILWLVESIDDEKRKRDAISDRALNLNYQISSISNIYIVVYDVDIIDDTFSIIKSENMIVNGLVAEQRSDVQFVINKVMIAITDESMLDEMLRFIDLSTLESRLSTTNTVTLEFITKTKKWIRIRFLASRRTNLGKLSHVLWLAEDINEEKTERDKLIDMSERAIAANEAKSSFLSNMSHEIRTPINAVLGMNEMILRECEDKNILEYSNNIMTAGNTLLGLINDILDFSKIESGKMEIIAVDYDLSTVINDLVTMIQSKADSKGLSLALDISSDIPKMLSGDEVRIKQIITNLLTNAVKYTEKGCVKFCIKFEKIPNDPENVVLDISVSDTGIGIKKEDMEKLFTEFDRIEEKRNRKIEGTGLGMSITKRLLEMMGSSLEVESVYGMGSKFSFRLKQKVVVWNELGDYEAAYKEALENRKKYREKFKAPTAEILVVDDTPVNLLVFRNLLKQTGMKIDTANSGDEGITAVLGNIYDIIFLDHMMPNKDGIQTLKEMRSMENNPNLDTVTICLTANAISGAREQYISEGFDDYMTKPIDPVKLEELLMRYLPESKIIYTPDEDDDTDSYSDNDIPDFLYDDPEINVETGIRNCGDKQSYMETLATFADTIDDSIEKVREYYDCEDIKNATVKIHAFKSISKIIGAADLGELAQQLENAGNADDTEFMAANIGEFLDRCRELSDRLAPLRVKQEEQEDLSLPFINDDEYSEICSAIKDYAADLDSLGIISAIEDMKKYRLTDEQKDKMQRVLKAADDFEYDDIPDIIDE